MICNHIVFNPTCHSKLTDIGVSARTNLATNAQALIFILALQQVLYLINVIMEAVFCKITRSAFSSEGVIAM